jgi:hypothetical protein
LTTLNEPSGSSITYIERIGSWVLAGKNDGMISLYDLNVNVNG